MMKKLTALLLALLMLLAVATGCSNDGKTSATKDPFELDDETKELYKNVVVTVDGNDITYEVYRYYFYGLYSSKISENPDYFKEEGALEELRAAVLDEIKTMFAVKELAKKYGIGPTEEQLKEMDEYIATLKTYLGSGFAQTLKEQYTSEELLREMLIYEQYYYAALYEYFESEECDVIDRSDEAVADFMKDYSRTLHILLTQKNYSTKENMEKVAELLRELISVGESAALAIKEDSDAAAAIAEIDKFVAKYEEAKSKMSYVGGMSVYADRLLVIKEELSAEEGTHPVFTYLSEKISKLSGETAINEVKNFATALKRDGIGEDTLTAWSVAYAAYNDMMNNEKNTFSNNEEAAWPSVAKQDVLFAMELIGALLKDHAAEGESITNTVKFLDKTFENVFVETTLIFGEDRQNPERGVYFKKGETDETFEEAFYKLEVGQISEPVYTKFGLHIITRLQPDMTYFKETKYNYLAGRKMIENLASTYEVEYGAIYETITPETLK